MKVIGTAGHIDHGKSTLVERLTGIDPDRLEEEKRRGMTIDLGFAWLTLPSGTGVSVVDVPGHERFVKNMLAGAAGIDVALLVVAADEGVMPQTREHLDIVSLLGIQHGVVALTKTDLVDEEWLALVEDDVRSTISGTGLENSAIVPVSAVSNRGVEELLLALDAVVRAAPDRSDRDLPYLPVDRVFSVTGFGTIVTGTIHGGSVAVGDEIEVLPGGRRGRIRSMQSHKRQVDGASPGDRVAINLGGVDREDVDRGDVVAPVGRLRAVQRFDAKVRVLDSAAVPIRHSMEVAAHVGAAERTATLSILGSDRILPGDDGWIQVRVSDPLVVVPAQRLILRLPAPARTIAGGEVVDVAPRHRRRDAGAVQRLHRLASDSVQENVLAALEGLRPRRSEEIAGIAGQSGDRVRTVLRALLQDREVVALGDWYVSWDTWNALVNRIARVLTNFHQTYPLRPGMSREELRSRVGWSSAAFHELLPALETAGIARLSGAYIALKNFAVTDTDGPEAVAVLQALRRHQFTPPSARELRAETGASKELLTALTRGSAITQVSDDLYFDSASFQELVNWTLDQIRATGTVTVAELRDHFGTSRKYALAFLEHLDAERVTRRQGDLRVLGNRAHLCV